LELSCNGAGTAASFQAARLANSRGWRRQGGTEILDQSDGQPQLEAGEDDSDVFEKVGSTGHWELG
jgi:hypothetical protein